MDICVGHVSKGRGEGKHKEGREKVSWSTLSQMKPGQEEEGKKPEHVWGKSSFQFGQLYVAASSHCLHFSS